MKKEAAARKIRETEAKAKAEAKRKAAAAKAEAERERARQARQAAEAKRKAEAEAKQREAAVATAVRFLSNDKISGAPLDQKRAFLEEKGAAADVIDEAIRRAAPEEAKVKAEATPAAEAEIAKLQTKEPKGDGRRRGGWEKAVDAVAAFLFAPKKKR